MATPVSVHRCRPVSVLLRRLQRMSSAATKPSQPITVVVEGNIGSGKTTFLNHFSKLNDLCAIFPEPVELWRDVKGHNLLGLMYSDTKRWSLTFQTYVQLSMTDLHTRNTSAPFKLMERSLFSARYCFVENLAKSGLMPEVEYIVLDEWFKWITANMNIRCDLIVYLRTRPDVVHRRIRERARAEESGISLNYLEDLHCLHEDWLHSRTRFTCPAPVVTIDADRSPSQMEEEYKKCELQILHLREVQTGAL
ncbi:deoxynucleoside kinase-like isoform X2 [Bacillus rossius redtenbacheri]|uniref:deoxynucleoside kinase-like isoform X2 n=1 Tax=Bacillus rossius redtenbacheri TaxID=93214 RepID=UPI002FDD8610